MSTSLTDRPPTPAAVRPRSGWFRAFWRWHFYASILVIPVLLVFAATGLIYLFRFQLEPMLHAEHMLVEQPAGSDVMQPYAGQQRAVERAHPDATVVSMAEPRSEGRSTVFSVTEEDGSGRDVFVDPWTAEVLGDLDPDTTLSGYAIRLHADLMSGVVGDRVMELGTCWALVMALTGYNGTSMWSLDHGAQSSPTSTLDESLPHSHAEIPWGLQKSEVPDGAEPDDEDSVANVDTAIAVGEREGLRHPMTVALPADDAGTFSAIGYAFDQPSAERTVHVDRYGGAVRATYGYDDYPMLAKVVSQGIGLHEGRSLGVANMIASAAFCLAVIAMCVTGPLMWWRRRPKGPRLGAPRGRLPVQSTPVLAVGLVVLGVFLPLFGISLVVVLLLDRFVLRRVPALGEFFGVSPS